MLNDYTSTQKWKQTCVLRHTQVRYTLIVVFFIVINIWGIHANPFNHHVHFSKPIKDIYL